MSFEKVELINYNVDSMKITPLILTNHVSRNSFFTCNTMFFYLLYSFDMAI